MTNDDFLMDEKNYENGIPTFRAEEPPGQPPPIESNADENNTDESFTISKQVGNNTYEQVRNPNYRPPGPRPTDDMLDLFEKRTAYETKVKEQLPDLDIDVVRIAERDTLSELYRDKSYLLYGRQTKEDESRYQAILNRNMQLAMQKQTYSRKLYDGAMNLFDEDVKTRRKHEQEMSREVLKGQYDLVKQGMIDKQKAAQEQEKQNESLKNIDLPSLVKSVSDGQDAPISIKNTRGANIHAMVKSGVLAQYPKFDFSKADANYKWRQSSTNQRTINFVGGALPRLGALDAQLKELPNVDLNVINRVMRQVLTEFGKPAYTNYESNRNAIVQEINTALSGTSQSSDERLKLELENLKSARSPQQIKGAIENLRLALEARLDVDLSPLYPIEVVRGEKTEEQYKKELYSKYRNDYSRHFGGEQQTTNKPTRTEYFAAMRKANPKASNQEINTYLDKKGVK